MREVRYSSKAKKDLKKYHNNAEKMRKLYAVLNFLARDLQLPAIYKAHKLIGDYGGCLECHIESDFLLVWIDEDKNIIEIVRLGSHSELFG